MLRSLLLFLTLIAASCTTDQTTPTPAPESTSGTRQIQATIGGVTLGVDLLPGWEAYIDNSHFTVVEKQPVMSAGALSGIVVNFWVPEPSLVSEQDDLTVADVLGNVVKTLESSNVAASEPQPFDWHGHDAAYYVLNSGDGNLTLVVAMMASDETGMIAMNISAPADHNHRLMDLLPVLFNNFSINGKVLSPEAFHNMPDELTVPSHPDAPSQDA